MSVVAGPEEALAALVDVMNVFMPTEAVAGSRNVDDAGRIEHRSESDLEEAGQECRAGLVRQGNSLLRLKAVTAAIGVVFDVAAGRLGIEPFSGVTLGCARPGRKFARGERPVIGECPVKTQFVPHHNQSAVQSRAYFVDGPEYEAHQLVDVYRRRLVNSCHFFLLRRAFEK